MDTVFTFVCWLTYDHPSQDKLILHTYIFFIYSKSFMSSLYHDHLDSLCDWIGFVVLLLLQDTGKVAQLPDRMSLSAFPG